MFFVVGVWVDGAWACGVVWVVLEEELGGF